MWGGFLDNRYLWREPTTEGADLDLPPHLPPQVALTYGQRWWLGEV